MLSFFFICSVDSSYALLEADPNIRDHSGKKPQHYVKQRKENTASKVPDVDPKSKHHRKTLLDPSSSSSPVKLRPLSAFTHSLAIISPSLKKRSIERRSFWQ